MTFDKSKWAVDGSHFNSDIRRKHSYSSGTDAAADVNTSGYLNDVAAEVSVGDEVTFYDTANDIGTTFYVKSNDGSIVDLTDGVTDTGTDSD